MGGDANPRPLAEQTRPSGARRAVIGRSQRSPSGERLTMKDIPVSEIPSVTASHPR